MGQYSKWLLQPHLSQLWQSHVWNELGDSMVRERPHHDTKAPQHGKKSPQNGKKRITAEQEKDHSRLTCSRCPCSFSSFRDGFLPASSSLPGSGAYPFSVPELHAVHNASATTLLALASTCYWCSIRCLLQLCTWFTSKTYQSIDCVGSWSPTLAVHLMLCQPSNADGYPCWLSPGSQPHFCFARISGFDLHTYCCCCA